MADFQKFVEQLQNFDVNDIDWDKIGVWPWPAKVFLCVAAVVVIFVGCHFLVVKDKNMQLETAKGKEKTLRQSFEAKAFEAANLERYRKQMEEMAGTIQALISRLPSDIEVPGLLEDIDDKATEARLEIETIKPEQERRTEFHIELPIQIKVVGGYHEFGAFVSGIAGMPRIVTLHDFQISRSKGDDSQLEMSITAKTYRYKNEG